MHIALFVPSLIGGGAERVALNLAHGMCEQGMQVDLVLAQATGDYIDAVDPRVNMVDLGNKRVLTAIPSMVRYLRRARPDAMIAFMDHANLIALWSRALSSVKFQLIVNIQSNLMRRRQAEGLKERIIQQLASWFYPQADYVVAVSNGVAESIHKALNYPLQQIQTIENPVIVPPVRDKTEIPLPHPWFADENIPVIVGVGRLHPAKDFATLIKAFSQLRKARQARLIILGEGQERDSLEALMQELGIVDDVSLPGFVDNPYDYLIHARLFVLSSRWEGFPNVLVEALAHGCPVVSTDCESGPAEILEDGQYGPLVPLQSPDALAKAMADTLDSPLSPEKLRARSLMFSLERITGDYITLLRQRMPQ